MAEEEVREAEARAWEVRPALVLDLDGTVRRSRGNREFIESPEDVEIYPDVARKLWEYHEAGWMLFGCSNQGGVAHGLLPIGVMHAITAATVEALRQTDPSEKQRSPLYAVKTCSYLPSDNRRRVAPYCLARSLSRKPDYGMCVFFEETAKERWRIVLDWDNSIVVGDREEDRLLAGNIGCHYMHPQQFFSRSQEEQTRRNPK